MIGLRTLFGESKDEQFWDWFVENSGRISESSSEPAVLKQVADKLSKVSPGLGFEIEQKESKPRNFVISANGVTKLFETVVKLVKVAPKMDGWKIVAFRQRTKSSDVAIEVSNKKYDSKKINFSYELNGDKIDLVLYGNDLEPGNQVDLMGVFVLLDALVGEYDVEMKLGRIDIAKDKSSSKTYALSKLPDLIDNGSIT